MAQEGYDDIYGDLYGSDEDDKPVVLAGSTALGSTSTPATTTTTSTPTPSTTTMTTTTTTNAGATPMQGVTNTGHVGVGGPGGAGGIGTGNPNQHQGPDEAKMFIGGLNWDTNEDSLKTYFSQFGQITQLNIMRDSETNRSRGFAFLTFENKASVDKVLNHGEHYLDGKTIDPKRAVPRTSVPKSDKLFIRLLPQTCTPESFKAFWEPYGNVTDATLMMDKETGRHRGFGFVNFESGESTDKVLASGPHYMDGNLLEVKRAQTKGEQKRPDYGIDTRHLPPNQHSAGGLPGSNPMLGGGGGMGNLGGGIAGGMMNPMMGGGFGAMPGMPAMNAPFDPNAMSKFFASMGWGAWNPMMMPGAAGGGAGGFDPSAMMGMMGGMGAMPGMGGMGGAAMPGMGAAGGAADGSGFAQPMRGGGGMRGGGQWRGGGRGGYGGGRGGHQGGAGQGGQNNAQGGAAGGAAGADGGAGPQRNAGRGGGGFHPYSR